MKETLFKYFSTLICIKNGLSDWYFQNVSVRNPKRWGKCSRKVQIGIPLIVTNIKHVYIDDLCRINAGGRLIVGTGSIHIKKYTEISYNVTIATGNHVSTVSIPQFFLGHSHINDNEKDVIINEDVWIGANVTILSGVNIGRGAIIAANSLVNKNVPPYAVMAGIPAKIIAVKFSLKEIIKHELELYPEVERIDIYTIKEFFNIHFKDKKVYGTSTIKEADQIILNKIKNKWKGTLFLL